MPTRPVPEPSLPAAVPDPPAPEPEPEITEARAVPAPTITDVPTQAKAEFDAMPPPQRTPERSVIEQVGDRVAGAPLDFTTGITIVADDEDWGRSGDVEPVYLTDGRIRFTACGIEYRLRRPTLGELEKLREMEFDIQDSLAGLSAAAAEAGLAPGAAVTDDQAEALKAAVERWHRVNAFNRENALSGTAQVASFMTAAVKALEVDDKELPNGFSEWPIWLSRARLATTFMMHWQDSTPEAPGVNGAQTLQGSRPAQTQPPSNG